MKLLRDVFRLRVSRGSFGACRDACVREFVVTVPAPLAATAHAGAMPQTVAPIATLPLQVAARAA